MPAAWYDLLVRLRSVAPIFSVDPRKISLLTHPNEYFLAIKTLELEKKLEQQSQTSFQLHVLLDCLRGTRGVDTSSASMLAPLVKDYPGNMTLSLYLTPHMRGGQFKQMLPERVNESFGVQHMKFCVFDNDVLVSGANLSESYFTDREDRYVLFKDAPKLANYFSSLVELVALFSNKMDANGETLTGHPNLSLSNFTAATNTLVKKWISKQIQLSDKIEDQSSSAYIVPSIQMAPFQVTQEQDVLGEIIAWSAHCTKVQEMVLSTGYFNVGQKLRDGLFKLECPVRLVTSSPAANSFYGASGLSGNIPFVYREFERQFLLAAVAGKAKNLGLYEYARPDWTFHAKGIWLDFQALHECMTAIGSSNYGMRSCYRDIEAQVYLFSNNPKLTGDIKQDSRRLFEHSSPVTMQDIPTSTLMTRVLAYAFHSML